MNKKELLKLQREATVLVNPVSPSQEFTNYFFPSKTMEYLSSGTPTLMFQLSCLPKEYQNHLYFFDNESIEKIKDKLVEICEKPKDELSTFGKLAADFIFREKNAKIQVKKLINLIEKWEKYSI